jgi:hypothetical protein
MLHALQSWRKSLKHGKENAANTRVSTATVCLQLHLYLPATVCL